ncbi:M48 family metallopeptidase [Halosolutus halophilus]|uniref:M48 family metallopeptidase n=1 Tax=Halosolutus halophilus TaxID=1552990 RepID=UPI002235065A|nr:M48 family metalloprotease [Halosolutus halophilus]
MSSRGAGRRVLLALVGGSVLVAYLGLAALTALGLAVLWRSTPDALTTLVLVVVAALLAGYLGYRFGTRQLLSRLDAAELPRSSAPEFYRRLDRLDGLLNVDRPRILVATLPTPNAFALGSARTGVVVLDRSLCHLCSVDELEALVAHELAHLESHDAFVQTFAYSLFRTVAGVVFLVLLPITLSVTGVARAVSWARGQPGSWADTSVARSLRWIDRAVAVCFLLVTAVVRAHSRRREYAADDRAAVVTGNPLALASALRTVQRAAEPRHGLLSPLYVHTDDEEVRTRLFETHPPTDDRIRRLVDRERERRGRTRGRERTPPR